MQGFPTFKPKLQSLNSDKKGPKLTDIINKMKMLTAKIKKAVKYVSD